MRRLLWLAVAAITAMLAVASSTAAAGARANTSESAQADVAVVSYAADYSVTHQEAQRRLDRIQPLQEILASIRTIESARLAGWGIDHTGTFTGWVWLTGDQPPTAAASRIAGGHTDVQIRTGATHTHAELLAAQTGLFQQQVGPTGHVTGGPETLQEIKRIVTYTSLDMRANAIEIGIDPALASTVPGGLTDTGPTAVTDEALQSKITEVTQQLQDHVDVSYIVEDGRGVSSAASFGAGENVRVEKGSEAFICTSGFTAQSNSGTYGIITAGHCGDNGPNETATIKMHNITLPHVNGWASVNADAQFHKIPTGSSHVLRDDYRCNVYRQVGWCDVADDIARSDMIDDYVCHTGRSSGITCGTVTNTSYQPTYTGACWSSGGDATSCNNVFVEVSGPTLKSCGGDSGGPWYRSGTAYGIHKGSNSDNKCFVTNVVAHFSAIDEVQDFLGVQILTNGNVTVS